MPELSKPCTSTRALAIAAAFAIFLAAAPAALGQVPEANAGPRLLGGDIHDPDDAHCGGRPAVSIAGARNGAFSGKVVLASNQPILQLTAAVGELRQGEAAIPASRLRVRYAVRWDRSMGGFRRPKGADILLESPPARLPAGKVDVWVTVDVPKAARAGAYAGELSIKFEGGGPLRAPVTINVQDWTLPDTQDFSTWVELVQSPDTLSVEYGVPLWSPGHWRLIEQSMRLIGATSSRVVYVPLICHTNLGNAESMVRWVPRGEGRWAHDFSIMDKYLDAAVKHMGRPKIVVFNVWDVYQQEKLLMKRAPPGADANQVRERIGDLHAKHGYGPAVTVAATDSAKTETRYLPRWSDPASKALWAPLFKEL
ncbi:MAG TPA: glycoside hydrolase domain-containing protein, partial [Phycisphaerae bacterium]|nr:glycoside hydrolase domain-containing protein [Phycisphaerae bacterium]